jgi:hypothetical protein
MIVLLHAYNKGFSALEVALMFSLYETAGVVTNLLAGLLGAKWGIRWTLLFGLTLQLVGLGLLYAWQVGDKERERTLTWSGYFQFDKAISQLHVSRFEVGLCALSILCCTVVLSVSLSIVLFTMQDDWSKTQAIIYVTFAQSVSGIAKDLTKLGGKTVTKLVTPDEKQNRLFKLVSLITGSKDFVAHLFLAYCSRSQPRASLLKLTRLTILNEFDTHAMCACIYRSCLQDGKTA